MCIDDYSNCCNCYLTDHMFSFFPQKNGKHILWSHVLNLYEKVTHTAVASNGLSLSLLPKLKNEHVSLTSYSRMRVDLAAQVQFAVLLYV